MWWHTRTNHISSFGETTSTFRSTEASVLSTTGSLGVRISCSNAGHTMFRGSVKGTGYPLYSPVSPSLPPPPPRASPCDIKSQLESTTVLNCHWLLALLESFPTFVCMYTACQFMAVVVWVGMTDLLTDTHLKYLLAFQLWHLEELRAESHFFASRNNDAFLCFCTRRIVQILH